MKYAIYSQASGAILRMFETNDSTQATLQVGPGEGMLEASDSISDATHRVVGGTIESIPAPTTEELLEAARAAKLEALNNKRDSVERSGFTWDGSTFDSDQVAQLRIQGAVSLAQIALAASQSFSIDWTLKDNSVRTLSASDMIAVGLAMGTHIITTFTIGRTLKAVANSATSIAELDAITWPT